MTPEEKALLQETHDLAVENARILRSLQRSQRLGTIFRVLYWVLIIGLSFGAFYLIQPYVNALQSSLTDMSGAKTTTTDPFSLTGAVNNLKQLQSLYQN